MDVLTAALMYLVGTGCSSGVLGKWAWIRAPATHFLGAQILTTQIISTPPAAFSALPQHLPTPFSVIVLSAHAVPLSMGPYLGKALTLPG